MEIFIEKEWKTRSVCFLFQIFHLAQENLVVKNKDNRVLINVSELLGGLIVAPWTFPVGKTTIFTKYMFLEHRISARQLINNWFML